MLFALVVVLTMFSAMMFDPRLTWGKTLLELTATNLDKTIFSTCS
ncbi:hypothetical protein O9422_18535, partial [Proteus mirabilis]